MVSACDKSIGCTATPKENPDPTDLLEPPVIASFHQIAAGLRTGQKDKPPVYDRSLCIMMHTLSHISTRVHQLQAEERKGPFREVPTGSREEQERRIGFPAQVPHGTADLPEHGSRLGPPIFLFHHGEKYLCSQERLRKTPNSSSIDMSGPVSPSIWIAVFSNSIP